MQAEAQDLTITVLLTLVAVVVMVAAAVMLAALVQQILAAADLQQAVAVRLADQELLLFATQNHK
jgi:hypothetical protein